MDTALSATEATSLGLLSVVCLSIIVNTFHDEGEPIRASLALSGIAFAFTYSLIRWLGNAFIKAGLKGRDMSKLGKSEMYVEWEINNGYTAMLKSKQYSPETMGAVCAGVYLLTIIIFIPFPFYKDIVVATSGGGNRDIMMNRQEIETGRILYLFPHAKV